MYFVAKLASQSFSAMGAVIERDGHEFVRLNADQMGVRLRPGPYKVIRWTQVTETQGLATVSEDGVTVEVRPSVVPSNKPDPCVVAFLPLDDPNYAADRTRGPIEILRQAIANLAAVRSVPLKRHERVLVVHFRDNRESQGGGPETRLVASEAGPTNPCWKLWLHYFQLRDSLPHLDFVPYKLYTHVWPAPEDLPQDHDDETKGFIDQLTTKTGKFNYLPLSRTEIELLLTKAGLAIVSMEDEFAAPSSLVRVFHVEGGTTTYVVLRQNTSPLTAGFCMLYEYFHHVKHLSGLVDLDRFRVSEGPRQTVHCLPPGLLGPVAEGHAEMFALAGLWPTPHLAWAFREAMATSTFRQACVGRTSLEPEIGDKMLGLLHDDFRWPVLPAEPNDWSVLLWRRLRSVFKHALAWSGPLSRSFAPVIPSMDAAAARASQLRGAWAIVRRTSQDPAVPADYVVHAVSPGYERMLGAARGSLIGRRVAELTDGPSRQRFVEVDLIRRKTLEPVTYVVGFAPGMGAGDGATVVARVVSWPILESGELVGALGVFEQVGVETYMKGSLEAQVYPEVDPERERLLERRADEFAERIHVRIRDRRRALVLFLCGAALFGTIVPVAFLVAGGDARAAFYVGVFASFAAALALSGGLVGRLFRLIGRYGSVPKSKRARDA